MKLAALYPFIEQSAQLPEGYLQELIKKTQQHFMILFHQDLFHPVEFRQLLEQIEHNHLEAEHLPDWEQLKEEEAIALELLAFLQAGYAIGRKERDDAYQFLTDTNARTVESAKAYLIANGYADYFFNFDDVDNALGDHLAGLDFPDQDFELTDAQRREVLDNVFNNKTDSSDFNNLLEAEVAEIYYKRHVDPSQLPLF